jgi:ABC-2 type transport system permease protein
VTGEDVASGVRAALAEAERENRRVLAINTVHPTLEDAFVQLTGLSAEVMLADDLRGMWYLMLKDLRTYYFKPPNISWGILFPFAFVLAFVIRDGAARDLGSLQGLAPGLLALTLLFGTSSMEAIVITFERRIGALERLLLAPIRLPALLAGKLLGGMVFGLMMTVVVLIVALAVFGAGGINWLLLVLSLILSAAAFSALGVLVSVSVKEVFEAQTLANAFRFPMMFLGGVFVPVASLPLGLQIVARALPLTYAVEVLHVAMIGGELSLAVLDLAILAGFTVVLFGLAVWVLARRIA